MFCLFTCHQNIAQGTWTQVTNTAPDANAGVTLQLSDGTVMVKSAGGFGFFGTAWHKLTPDNTGSYINGTWSTLSGMNYDRLYFSSQVLMNGQVYVAGGEYGSGYGTAEVYDPVLDTWNDIPQLTPGDSFEDANSEILPDGRIMQSTFFATQNYSGNYIFDPASSTFSIGPTCIWAHLESTWLKLPDESILFVDFATQHSERYIPSLGVWIADDSLPVPLYDTVIFETGPAVLLPDGRAFFMGATGNTAFYTPSGTTSPGVWTAGPVMPDSQSMPDASAAMMVNGKVLLVTSAKPQTFNNFPSPMSFYVFDYITDSFTRIPGPFGEDTVSAPPYITHMLDLADGTVMLSFYDDSQYYIYTPDGFPLAAGKPGIDNIIRQTCDTYMITGKLFNGITEGASYGDDWQMASNYPLVRLLADTNVFYARTYNWNRTDVMTGSLEDTTMFVLPAGLNPGTYSLEVVANGNPSNPVSFTTCPLGIATTKVPTNAGVAVYPNPATDKLNINFQCSQATPYTISLMDLVGQTIITQNGKTIAGYNTYILNLTGLPKGIYVLKVNDGEAVYQVKVAVE